MGLAKIVTDCVVCTVKEAFKDNQWTIYFVVDFQLVFIFTHIYTSAINFISTTANSEATKDRVSGNLFNVTDIYSNVRVTEIDDAVLWNCREHSVTKEYYRFLYWMSIIALGIGLLIILVVKLVTFVKLGLEFNSYTLTKLWHMAVTEHLKEASSTSSNNSDVKTENKMYETLLKSNAPDDDKMSIRDKILKTVVPCALTVVMVCIMFFFFLSYDLHPLACIKEPGSGTIGYKSNATRVIINYPDSLLTFQRASFVIIFSLICVHIGMAGLFYWHTRMIRDCLLKNYKDFIKEKVTRPESK